MPIRVLVSTSVSLLILSDCEPGYYDSEVRTVELPFCGCPTVSSFSATAVSGNPCRWIFEAKIGGAFAQCVETYVWSFGDGGTDQTDVPVAEHIYADDGDYDVTLTMVGVGQADGGPCSYAQEITVSNCHDGDGGRRRQRSSARARGGILSARDGACAPSFCCSRSRRSWRHHL